MIALFLLGIVFLFWALIFAYYFPDQYIALPGAVVATGLTFWAFSVLSQKRDKKKSNGGS